VASRPERPLVDQYLVTASSEEGRERLDCGGIRGKSGAIQKRESVSVVDSMAAVSVYEYPCLTVRTPRDALFRLPNFKRN